MTSDVQDKPASSPLSAADQHEIRALISEYSIHEDCGNAEAWAQLFTSDGSFYGSGKPSVHGRDNLLASAHRRWAERPEVHGRVHWVSNIIITADPLGARASSYQMTTKEIDGVNRITAVSGKEDILRKENGKWRFHVRRVVPIGADNVQ
jgi:uncharacterized protein (TIGR02246 family)